MLPFRCCLVVFLWNSIDIRHPTSNSNFGLGEVGKHLRFAAISMSSGMGTGVEFPFGIPVNSANILN